MKYLMVVISFSAFVSCRKLDSEVIRKTKSDILSVVDSLNSATILADPNDTIRNFIYLGYNEERSSNISSSSAYTYDLTVVAKFNNSQEDPVSAGNIYINNNTISPYSDNSYHYSSSGDYSSSGSTQQISSIGELNGQTATLELDGGSGFSSFTETIRVPAKLNFSANLPYQSAYIEGSDINLTWTPDSYNAFGKVFIECYLTDTTIGINNDEGVITYIVPDNGSYTIPANALSAFVLDKHINISISRLTQYVENSTNAPTKIDVFVVAHANTESLLIMSRPSVYVRLERTNDYYYSDPYVLIESTYYVTRFYYDGAASMPVPLGEYIQVNYNYRTHQYDGSSYDNDVTNQYSLNASAGSTESSAIGSTQLKYYANGMYSEIEVWLTSGQYYNITY